MITLHPEYLIKNGNPEFVVLPYDEFAAIEQLLEEKDDEQSFREAKAQHNGGPTKSLRELEAELSAN
ncbi:MAG TPA: type II toxin-antitoxin system Phd/YefM family antitoxin [Candidatus Kapabacteria bacterium]|nr:type II toxin-antitoxin system Phd/YefM family antitoxin [Candidatus Kapabacteria bacterium]